MEHVKNGIAALYSIIEKYRLNEPTPYILGNFVNIINTFVFKDWVFVLNLIIVICLDTALGVALALKKRKFSSWGFGKVFSKIAIYGIVLVATHNATLFLQKTAIKELITVIDSTVYAAIMIREFLSLVEKIPAFGIWKPPAWLFNRLQIWYDTGEFKEGAAEEKDKKKEAE